MATTGRKGSMRIVPAGKKKCIWMEAGVVSYKLCDNNYDCSTCLYDHAMQLKVAQQKEAQTAVPSGPPTERFNETWVERMMQLPASHRKCRYMITGEVSRKICPNAYECGNCSFDQMMQERLQAEVLPVRAVSQVAGFELAEDIYYYEGHTWARPEYGGRVRVGLNDFAQKLIGPVGGIELPSLGHELRQGQAGFLVRRNGDFAQILSPMDGIVVHANERVLDRPTLINESPYEKGWLFIIEPTELRKNLKALYFGEDARAFIAQEGERLLAMANEDLRIAADGGVPVEDILKELGAKSWSKVVKTFFRT